MESQGLNIRPITQQDLSALKSIIDDTGLFPSI